MNQKQYFPYGGPIPQFGRAFKNAPEESNAQDSRVYQTYRPIPQFGRDGEVSGVSDTKQYLPYRPLSAQFGRESEVYGVSNSVRIFILDQNGVFNLGIQN